MSIDLLIDLLWLAHLGLSLGLLTVLLLRRPWRRLAGAQAAYTLWLLPLWWAVAALLPRSGLPGWVLPAVLVNTPQASSLGSVSMGPRFTLGGAWAVGVLTFALLQWGAHWRYRRRLLQLEAGHLQAPAGDSPGLFGLWRPRLVLPADFRQRFDAAERRWILAHESAHARRLDNPTRVFATVVAGLAWFNPLAWWALGALRHDQELACDAAVMRRYPTCWRRYGLAMLKLEGALRVPPTASAWQSTHPLKERIMLLQSSAPSVGARNSARLGLVLSGVLGFGAIQATHAGLPDTASANKPTARHKELADVTEHPALMKVIEACPQMPLPPGPPPEAINGEFLLNAKFKVGRDGRPGSIEVQGDPRLVDMIERSVRAYGCKPELAGTELRQKFFFRLE